MYEKWSRLNSSYSKYNIIQYFRNWKYSYVIFKSGMFDANYYLREYSDVANKLSQGFFYRASLSKNKLFRTIGKAIVHPIRHYVWHGVFEKRNPSASFVTEYYLNYNYDVALSRVNPFFHYVTCGKLEGRKARPEWYKLAKESNLLKLQIDTLRNSELFDQKFYLENNPDVRASGMDAVEHYCKFGWKEGRNPSLSFNTSDYLKKMWEMQELHGEKINPFFHYLLFEKNESISWSDVDRGASYKRNKTILFVGHEAEQTGAPVILLDIIKWFNEHTAYKVKTLLLRGGKLLEEYENVTDILVVDNLSNKQMIKHQVEKFIGNDDCLIFLNTIVSARALDFIDTKKFQVISYIHEMEKTLKMFPAEVDRLVSNVRTIIGASGAVTENLRKNHGYREEELNDVHAFIDPQHQVLDIGERNQRREELNITTDSVVIFGCGSIYWRKNPKGFIEVAEKVLSKTNIKCEFIWIGEGEEKAICENLVIRKKLSEKVRFIGAVDNPRSFFAMGDIFLLPSLEDPFPLVCLEAADCGLPVVCFEGAGGMPTFVENDAGCVVPFNDTEAMANALIRLIEDNSLREKTGIKAREKVLARHTIQNSVHKIKKIIDTQLQTSPALTVIVPNYNHSKYLHQRLDSIYNQTFQDIEVILLDDMSTDNSRDILDHYAASYPEITRRMYNDVNSGSVFKQWLKGIAASHSEFIWIAESDDFSDEHFVEQVLPAMKDEDVILSYSNSNIVSSNGKLYNTYDNAPWLTDISLTKWANDYLVEGSTEFYEALAVKCTIPNVSGVIFRKHKAEMAIESSFSYKKAGDWIFYAHMARHGKISYCAKPLNYHRRHEGTVTSKEGDDLGIQEIFRIHKYYLDNFYVPERTRDLMLEFVESEYNIYRERGSVSKPLEKLYNKVELIRIPKRPKIMLFQHGLNFGKGGAEKILIEKANFLFIKGYDVLIYNRTHLDAPLPYKLNPNVSVRNIGVSEDMTATLLEDKPDVAIVFSIGHPDSKNIIQIHNANIPVILTLHNQPKFFEKSLGDQENKRIINLADRVVTLLPSFKAEYISKGFDDKFEVIPNFVNRPKIYNEFTGIPNKKFIFNAGRLVDQKQQSILIDAFAEIASDYPDYLLIIAGEGHLRPRLEQQIIDRGMEGRIQLLGEIQNIGDYYKYCDFFVLSSKFEGFSLVPIEAASYGKPVILFKDCPPYNQLFGENDCMIRVNKMDSESLANAFRMSIQNRELWNEEDMINFYNMYSPNEIISNWEDLIKKVIDEQKNKTKNSEKENEIEYEKSGGY